jgi:predicted DNA-binding protein
MATQTKRTTIYLDPALYKTLRLKAVVVSKSVSELINEAIKESLEEDYEDISAFEERAKEPIISYEEMIKSLKKDGKI